GRKVSRLAVGNRDVKPSVDVFTPPREVRAPSKGGPHPPQSERIDDDLPFDSGGGLSFQHTFPLDGEYVFKIQGPRPNGGPGGAAAPTGNLELRISVKAGVRHVS